MISDMEPIQIIVSKDYYYSKTTILLPREREIVTLTEMVKWNKHIFFSKLFTVKYFML
jgi:hypothetical protein